MHTLRLATRRSALALAQAELVAAKLRAIEPALAVEIVGVETSGDRDRASELAEAAGRSPGIFVKEVEAALLEGSADAAVHSLKDLPTALPAGLCLAAVPEREDPRDALVSRGRLSLEALPPGARVGTSSPRRAAFLRALRPDLEVVPLRGNVETRLRRVREGAFEATVLALAGLRRLGREAEAADVLDPERFVPAPAQGALALEARAEDAGTRALLRRLAHAPSEAAVAAERALLVALGGGCALALGAWARVEGGRLVLACARADERGRLRRARLEGDAASPEALGARAAASLREP